MNQALGKFQTPKNPSLVLASSSPSWLMMNSFRNGMLVESMGRHKWLCYQRKLMTIFSPPPTIHLVVVTSLPFGFALMSRRGVNQTFFCENNQNSIKHLCIQNTKFLCMENTRNRIEKTKICWFTTIPSKITKILFVAHRPRIIKQYLRGHFSFLRQFTLKKAVRNHQLC